MSDDFGEYMDMKEAGCSPEEVYRKAVRGEIDLIARIRMIRSVFRLSLREAKEVLVRAEGESRSLDQHQEKIANELVKASLTKEGS